MFDLANITSAIQLVKDVHGMLSKLEAVKQEAGYCDKLEEILNLRMTLIDAKEEIVELRSQLAEAKKRQDIENRLKFDEKWGVYFMEGDTENHAYCPKCWNEKSKTVPMKKYEELYKCCICRTCCYDPDHKPIVHHGNPYQT